MAQDNKTTSLAIDATGSLPDDNQDMGGGENSSSTRTDSATGMPPPLPATNPLSKSSSDSADLQDAIRNASPPPLSVSGDGGAAGDEASADDDGSKGGDGTSSRQTRRTARRRPAGPVRGRVAANDDAPSIGGLIYALQQRPTIKPFRYAALISVCWAVLGSFFGWMALAPDLAAGLTVSEIVSKPVTFLTFAAIIIPIVVIWFLALLVWRTEELKLRSSTMTEVAVRLAEPDRLAEQSVASLGQAVRRQVSFMNDAVSRALGRAGELEALVHNEVAALEQSYEENEKKIRSLISELADERHALLNTGGHVTDTLEKLGEEIPTLMEKLSGQQAKLSHIIEGAGENLTALETSLGGRTEDLQVVLTEYTGALDQALATRTDEMKSLLGDYTSALAHALGSRSDQMEDALEDYARNLDERLASRAEALDVQLIERTRALDDAFNERLRLFDESVQRTALAIDSAVEDKARALTGALEAHALTFKETIGRQATDLDESLVHGINSVRRSSENITRQSLKAIEGLASQSDLLKSVSENLLGQINTVANRFENQGQSIMKAANALETVNYKIDSTLENRHAQLETTLGRLSGKADEFGRFVSDYSTTIEGSLSEAEMRARATAEQLREGAQQQQQAALAHLDRLRDEADAHSQRTLGELRDRFANVSKEVTSQLGNLSGQFEESTEDIRRRTAQAAESIAEEQARLRAQLESLPKSARESSDVVRRAIQDQLKALDQLSHLTTREAQVRDVNPPRSPSGMGGGPPPASLVQSYASQRANLEPQAKERSLSNLSSNLARELAARGNPVRPSQQQRGAAGAAQGQRTAPGHAALSGPKAGPGPGSGPESIGTATDAAQSVTPGGDRWLGNLLKRASTDDEGIDDGGAPPAARSVSGAGTIAGLDLNTIARSLDPATARDIWGRLRGGQRGVLVRSIYTPEGRAMFDEVASRYKTEAEFQRHVATYMADFEGSIKTSERQDPTGQLVQEQLLSAPGRIYLLLAHASGRLG